MLGMRRREFVSSVRRRGGVNPDNLAAMISLAAPIALAVFAVLAWRYETCSGEPMR